VYSKNQEKPKPRWYKRKGLSNDPLVGHDVSLGGGVNERGDARIERVQLERGDFDLELFPAAQVHDILACRTADDGERWAIVFSCGPNGRSGRPSS